MPKLEMTDSSDALLHRLEWTVIRRLDGLLQGDHRTLMRGGGVDLADLREYQLHDDVRHIDWNVTARLQTPYVRQFIEDRDLTAWFLLDLSGSVDFGSADTTKLAVSTGFVATIARVITRHGNRAGALLYGHKVDTVLQPGMTFHFMPGLWMDDWGLEITESILITETGVETLCNVPRQLFVKD